MIVLSGSAVSKSSPENSPRFRHELAEANVSVTISPETSQAIAAKRHFKSFFHLDDLFRVESNNKKSMSPKFETGYMIKVLIPTIFYIDGLYCVYIYIYTHLYHPMSSIIIPFGGAIVNGRAYIVPVWDLNRSHKP